jgi:hypothetical protein
MYIPYISYTRIFRRRCAQPRDFGGVAPCAISERIPTHGPERPIPRAPAKWSPRVPSRIPRTCAQEATPERACQNGSCGRLREFPVHVPTKLTRESLPKWILLVPTRIHLTCAQWAAPERACQSGSLHVPPKPHPREISQMGPAKPYLREPAKMDPVGAFENSLYMCPRN